MSTIDVGTWTSVAPGESAMNGGVVTGEASYVGGRVTKLNRAWVPRNVSGDTAIATSFEVLTSRVRDLIRNDAVLSKVSRMATATTIGAGLQTFSSAVDYIPSFEDFSEESDEEFEEWANNEADATGRMSYWDMQRLSFKDMSAVGLSIWLEVIDASPDRLSPLCYQLIEFEQLDRTMDRPSSVGRNKIVNGLELNGREQIVAAWIWDTHPYDAVSGGLGNISNKSRRIPASRLILNFLPDRPSSNSGASWYSSLVQVSRDRDRMLANILTTTSLQALMALVRTGRSCNNNLANSLTGALDSAGRNSIELGYPSMIELSEDEDVKIIESNRKDADPSPFMRYLHMHTAMGSGISLSRLTGDASEGTFASTKAVRVDDEALLSPVQQHQALRVALPIRRRFNAIHASLGRFRTISPMDFVRQSKVLQKFDIVPSADPDLQPKEDGEAAIDRMRSGRTTFQYECARLGFNWRRQLKKINQVSELAKKHGIHYVAALDWTKGQGGAPGQGEDNKKEGKGASQPA